MLSQLTQLKETGIWIIEVPSNGTPLNIKYPDNLIQIDKEFYEILGTITPDNISFDPAPYLPKILGHHYPDYLLGENAEIETLITDANESFYTLLNSCGYYWVNPCGEERDIAYDKDSGYEYSADDKDKWYSFESKLIKGILLALIKK